MGGADSADFRIFKSGISGKSVGPAFAVQIVSFPTVSAPILRFSGFSGFRDLTSRRRTRRSRGCVPPPTHLTRFLGGRAPRLSNFSDSGGLGGLGGYEPGGRWGAPVLQISGIFDFGSPANPSGRRLRYKSSTFDEYRTTPGRIYVSERESSGFRENPSGGRLLYKSSTIEHSVMTLDKEWILD